MNLSLCHNSHRKLITTFVFPKKSRKNKQVVEKINCLDKANENRANKPTDKALCQQDMPTLSPGFPVR